MPKAVQEFIAGTYKREKKPSAHKKHSENVISRDLYNAAKASDKAITEAKERERVKKQVGDVRVRLAKIKDTKEAEEGLEKRIAGYQKEAEEQEQKQLDSVQLDRVLEAYKKADTVDKFLEYMLETSDLVLTQERAKKDPAIAKYLKSHFKEQELGARYEDFIEALPSEQDYIDKARGKTVREAEVPQKHKKIPEKNEGPSEETLAAIKDARTGIDEQGEPAGVEEREIIAKEPSAEKPSSEKVEIDRQYAKELRAEEAQAAYVQAYKEYDPKFTKNKTDDLIAVTRPPLFAGKELKRLYAVMEKARTSMASEAGRTVEFKADQKTGLSAEVKKELESSNKRDELLTGRKGKKTATEVDEFLDKTEGYNYHQEVTDVGEVRWNLVRAYKDMGVKITGDNAEEVLAKKPPFSYIFTAKGRKVRDLYDKYVKALK